MTEDWNRENYEKSYKSMWEEIFALRRHRDHLQSMVDAASSLALVLNDDLETGAKTSIKVVENLRVLNEKLKER